MWNNCSSSLSGCACSGSRAQVQTLCQNHISSLRAQALMAASITRHLRSAADRWTQCGCSERQTDQTPPSRTHPTLDVLVQTVATSGLRGEYFFHFVALLFSGCQSTMQRAHAEVYDKFLCMSHLLEPGWSLLCSGAHIPLDSSMAVFNLSNEAVLISSLYHLQMCFLLVPASDSQQSSIQKHQFITSREEIFHILLLSMTNSLFFFVYFPPCITCLCCLPKGSAVVKIS